MVEAISNNPIVQTYQRNGRIVANQSSQSIMNPQQAAGSTRSFADLVADKVKAPLEASRMAEQAPALKHQGKISQEEYSMIMNEAQIQLSEFKATVEKSLAALQEILRSTYS
jgi:flagellar hook-basal body complex protein FliE